MKFPINWNWVNNTCSFDWDLILFWKSETTDFLATKTRTFFESLALTEWAGVRSAVAIWRSSTLKPVETEDSGSASSGGRVHPTSRFRRVRQVFLEKTKTFHVSFKTLSNNLLFECESLWTSKWLILSLRMGNENAQKALFKIDRFSD